MKVLIYGGPREGEILTVADHVHEITFPIHEPVTSSWLREYDAPPLGPTFKTITLPIRKNIWGQHVVIWKED